jgi:hypothetical protein
MRQGRSSAYASSTRRRVVPWTRTLATVSSHSRSCARQVVPGRERAGAQEVLLEVEERPLDLAAAFLVPRAADRGLERVVLGISKERVMPAGPAADAPERDRRLVVVGDAAAHAAVIAERLRMRPPQGGQPLVTEHGNEVPARVGQDHREGVHNRRHPGDDQAVGAPVRLRLDPGSRLEPAKRLALRRPGRSQCLQVRLEDRAAARVAPLPQLAEDPRRAQARGELSLASA